VKVTQETVVLPTARPPIRVGCDEVAGTSRRGASCRSTRAVRVKSRDVASSNSTQYLPLTTYEAASRGRQVVMGVLLVWLCYGAQTSVSGGYPADRLQGSTTPPSRSRAATRLPSALIMMPATQVRCPVRTSQNSSSTHSVDKGSRSARYWSEPAPWSGPAAAATMPSATI
jgi:hypothetical protein